MRSTKSEPVHVGLIGISGYGERHLENLKRAEAEGLCRLEAVVVKTPYDESRNEREREAELRDRGIRVYRSHDEMYASERERLGAVMIPVGISLHAPMSIAAMRSGLHVYCEKPAAGSYQEALRMLGASVQYQRRLAIGFQNVATASIQRIKELRIAGRLGALRSARTRVLWPRSAEYYARNAWAGKLMVDGKSIYDSPMQNATSHFLQNMLYVAGASPNETASPVRIYAENYRAHQIQSADTQFLRLHTAEGVEIVFATTHACSSQKHPVTEYRFEGGRIEWDMEGTTRLYEEGAAEPSESWDNNGVEVHYASFLDFFASLTEDREPVASIGNSLAQVFVVENAFASSGRVVPVGPDHRSIDSNRGLVSIDGIEDAVERAYVEGESFFEQGLPWARQSRTLDVSMS